MGELIQQTGGIYAFARPCFGVAFYCDQEIVGFRVPNAIIIIVACHYCKEHFWRTESPGGREYMIVDW